MTTLPKIKFPFKQDELVRILDFFSQSDTFIHPIEETALRLDIYEKVLREYEFIVRGGQDKGPTGCVHSVAMLEQLCIEAGIDPFEVTDPHNLKNKSTVLISRLREYSKNIRRFDNPEADENRALRISELIFLLQREHRLHGDVETRICAPYKDGIGFQLPPIKDIHFAEGRIDILIPPIC
mgnify:CR=1 FL=1